MQCKSRIAARRASLLGAILAIAVAAPSLSQVRAGEPELPIPIAEVKRDAPVDYAKEIEPIFKQHCVACHNATTNEGSLNLESPQTMLKGGDSGPALVAGNAAESLILERATGSIDPLMPPPGNKANAVPLSSEQLGLVKLWIEQGATGTGSTAESIAWQPLPPGVNPIYAVAVSPDGLYAACARANQVFIYHAPTGRVVCRLTDPELLESGLYQKPGVADLDLIQSLAFSPDGQTLASGGYRTIKLWTRPRNVRAASLDVAAPGVTALATSADQKWIAAGTSDGHVKLWTADGTAGPSIAAHEGAVASLAFTADGTRLYSVGADRTIRAWQVADGASAGGIIAPAPLHAVALVGEDKQIAAAGEDHVIRLWDAAALANPPADVAPVRELSGHSQPVTSLAAVPGAPAQLLSGSLDGTARVWDTAEGKQTRQLDHGGPVAAVAVRPDGAQFATAGANGVARLWNAADGKPIAEMRGDFRAQLQVAAAERTIAGRKSDIAVLTAAVTAAEKSAESEAEGVKKATEAVAAADKALADATAAAKTAADEKTAAETAKNNAVAANKAAEEAKAAAEKSIAELDAAAKTIAAMAAQANAAADAAPENVFLAGAKAAGEKAIADNATQLAAATEAKAAAEKTLAEAPAAIKAAEEALAAKSKAADDTEAARKQAETAKTAADQSLAAANVASQRAADAVPKAKQDLGNGETAVTEAEAALESAKQAATATEQPLRAIAFAPDGSFVATAGDDRMVHLWSAETGAPFETYAGHESPIRAMALLGRDRLVSGADEAASIVWELEPEWTHARTIGSPNSAELADRVTALDFSPDGQFLASGSGEPSRAGELKIWNVVDGTLVREIADAHSDTIYGIDFSPDGQHVASCGADKFVKVFAVADGSPVRAFEGHTHHVLSVAWQAQGRMLASGGADSVVKLWNFDTGEQARTIGGFGKEVHSVAFVGTSDEILTCAGDKLVSLYKAENGRKVRDFGGASDFVYSAGITPDGKLVVAGGQDSTLRTWHGPDAKAIHALAPPEQK